MNKSNEAVTAEATAFAALLNSGFIDILDGVQPANVATAITTQTLLVILPFAVTAAASVTDGVVTFDIASMIANAETGVNSTGTWARLYKSDHTTAVCDVTVGESGTELIIDSATIMDGNEIKAVAPFNYVVPKA